MSKQSSSTTNKCEYSKSRSAQSKHSKDTNLTSSSVHLTFTEKIQKFFRGKVKKESKYCWFLLFVSMFIQGITFGFLNIFGIFYVHLRKEFGPYHTKIAWIGSGASGILLMAGPLSVKLKHTLGFRRTIACGSVICFVAILTTSFMTHINVFFGTFSLLYGLGGSCTTICTNTFAALYFEKQMPVACGIVSAGSSLMTLLFSYGSERAISAVGWRTTWRIFSSFQILNIMLAVLYMPVAEEASVEQAESADLQAKVKLWKNRVFIIWLIAVSLVMFGYLVPIVHLVNYAEENGIPHSKGANLITALSAAATLGKLAVGKITSIGILNTLHTHQLAMVLTGSCNMLLPSITSYTGLIIYVLIVGFFSSCHNVLVPVITTNFVGTRKMALAFGFMNCFSSVFYMSGPAVAGALHEKYHNYNVAFRLAAAPMIVSAMILFFIPWAQRTTLVSIKINQPEQTTIETVGETTRTIDQVKCEKLFEKYESNLKNLLMEFEINPPSEDNTTETAVDREIELNQLRKKTRPRFTSLDNVDNTLKTSANKSSNPVHGKDYSSRLSLDFAKYVGNAVSTSAIKSKPIEPQTIILKPMVISTDSLSVKKAPTQKRVKSEIFFAQKKNVAKIPVLNTEYIGSLKWHTATEPPPQKVVIIPPFLSITMNKTSLNRRSPRIPSKARNMNVIYESHLELEPSVNAQSRLISGNVSRSGQSTPSGKHAFNARKKHDSRSGQKHVQEVILLKSLKSPSESYTDNRDLDREVREVLDSIIHTIIETEDGDNDILGNTSAGNKSSNDAKCSQGIPLEEIRIPLDIKEKSLLSRNKSKEGIFLM